MQKLDAGERRRVKVTFDSNVWEPLVVEPSEYPAIREKDFKWGDLTLHDPRSSTRKLVVCAKSG